jgi:succinate dehydrogenase / fumarate reductase, flavoprotein subunit
MQGLADGYFVAPLTVGNYLAAAPREAMDADHPAAQAVVREVEETQKRLLGIQGSRTVDSIHMELGRIMWDHCGMARNAEGLRKALEEIPRLRQEFWENVRVPGSAATLNQSLEKAGRVADFLEFAETMCHDALTRDESCGGHFREEHVTADGEARRDDENFAHAAVWEFRGVGEPPIRHEEPLTFDHVPLSQRSYK